MSFNASSWAWETIRESDLSATRRLVLLALAECLNEQTGSCHPSAETLVSMTGMKRDTIFAAIAELESIGLVQVTRKFGIGNLYKLSTTSPENGTSPKNGTSPEKGTTPVPKKGRVPVPKTGHKPRIQPRKNQEYISPPLSPPLEKPKDAHGSRLSPDWVLPAEYRQWASQFLTDPQPGEVDRIAEEFRDYWIATPGQKGRKSDWAATWRNWIRKNNERRTKNAERRQDNSAVARTRRACEKWRKEQERKRGGVEPGGVLIEGEFEREPF